MLIHKINDRVKFGNKGKLTGTIVGHGTMVSPGGSTLLTYAVRLDKHVQGYLKPSQSFISTMLVCRERVEKI